MIVSNCSFKPVVKHHGVPFLEKKQSSLEINNSNKNDIIDILGYPSTKSKFDNDMWIYVERKLKQSGLINLGKMKITRNDVLVLEIDKYGVLIKKKFYNMDEMNKLSISDNKTSVLSKKDTFIRSIIMSLRQKINDPLGKKRIKN